MSVILIPGSYDVPTKGHEQIWRQFAAVGEIVVAVGKNAEKGSGTFTPAMRVELCDRVLRHAGLPGRVMIYDGALVDVVEQTGASLVVRGVRGPSDLEEGFVFVDHLERCGSAPVAFAPSPAGLRGVSSSLVRQLLGMPGMGAELARLLPDPVYRVVRHGAAEMKEMFCSLWDAAGLKGDPVPVFEDLLLRYGDSRREYHTMEHVRWTLKRLYEIDSASSVAATSDPRRLHVLGTHFAVWFHDAVMEGAPTDEEASATLASEMLKTIGGATERFAKTVSDIILATAHTADVPSFAASVVDADLSILAATEEKFDRYEALIRKEWAHVPEAAFREGRARILDQFVHRPYVYSTEYARREWESKARSNLHRSIHRLRSGEPLPVSEGASA